MKRSRSEGTDRPDSEIPAKSAGNSCQSLCSHGLLYYGKEMTTVRDLKDEIDKRAYHKMLKQLCLSERDFE